MLKREFDLMVLDGVDLSVNDRMDGQRIVCMRLDDRHLDTAIRVVTPNGIVYVSVYHSTVTGKMCGHVMLVSDYGISLDGPTEKIKFGAFTSRENRSALDAEKVAKKAAKKAPKVRGRR